MDRSVAIVTGGSRGIGRAIVSRLQADGWQVATCGLGEPPADLQAELWEVADVSRPEDAARLFDQTVGSLGPVSLLVNNAGVQVEKTLAESTDGDWDRVVGTNCRGVFNMCRQALPGMSRDGGCIVNLGSISGMVADPSMALYNASKAFVHGLTRSIAVDHGPRVRCNAVCPGWIMTELADDAFALASDPGSAKADAVARHPVGRLGNPDDVAEMVAWLASERSSYVSGQMLTVDGGMTAASPVHPGLF